MDLAAERENTEADLDVDDVADELVYPTVVAFVEEHLAPMYARKIDAGGRGTTMTWCAQWWRYPEAVSRLTGLWKAWESLRKDPTTGLAVWWRDYADPMMRVLLEMHGPFDGCGPREHSPRVAPLATVPPPPGLFD